MRYRRALTPGASFFFTVVTRGRRPIFASAAAVEVLRCAFRTVRQAHPFEIDAMAVMPDHLHCIWTLPAADADFPTRWRLIKTWFSKHCDPALRARAGPGRSARREMALWQPRYWEHLLRDETDFIRHADYIHFNPVRHGFVASALDWPYSSFRRYVELGVYPADWGGVEPEFSWIGRE